VRLVHTAAWAFVASCVELIPIDLLSWLAQYGKEIFGTLFAGGIVWSLVAWFDWRVA
jgi:hypothetical protein